MINKTVLIHVDGLRREYPADWLLAQKFEKKGYRVFLSSRPTTRFLASLVRPDILILSHVFLLDMPYLRRIKAAGTLIYVNEVEGVVDGNEVGVSGTYPEEVDYSLFDGIFVWSDWSMRWLMNNRVIDPVRGHAIGSIRNSLVKYVNPAKGAHTVGFLSRFEMLNQFDGRHPFSNLLAIDPDSPRGRSYLNRHSVDALCFSIGMQIVGKLIDQGVHVLMRPHPNEDIGPYQLLKDEFGSNFDIDDSPDFMGFLNRVSVVLSSLSTALSEPYLLKIPIVSLSGIPGTLYNVEHQQPLVKSFIRACYNPDNIEEIVRLCSVSSLEPKQDLDMDDTLASMYSLGLENDPIDGLVEIVDKAAQGVGQKTQIRALFSPLLKLGLDVTYLFYTFLSKNPKLALRTLKQYHYNSLVHRPTEFMMRIKRAIG